MNNIPIFLDRDGVINKFPGCGDYVKSEAEFEFIPGSISALKKLSSSNYDIYIISNQSGVAKGLYTEEDLNAITSKMLNELNSHGIEIKKVFYCTHLPDEGCLCRKPSTYNIEQVLRGYSNVDRTRVYMVGDDEKDMIMGKNAGIKTALILGGAAEKCKGMNLSVEPDMICDSLSDFVSRLL